MNKIYISYAEADEEWVVQFVKSLKINLKKQLGSIDDVSIWAKYMLRGTDNKDTEPQKHLSDSTILLAILSPAYLRLKQYTEINNFLNKIGENSGRIFIIEHNKIERPKNIKNLYGYQFWYEDDRENVHILGMSQLENEYHQKILELSQDLAEKIQTVENEKIGKSSAKEQKSTVSNDTQTTQITLKNTGTIQNANINLGDNNQQFLQQPEKPDNSETTKIQKQSLTYQRWALIATGTIALAAFITLIFKLLGIL